MSAKIIITKLFTAGIVPRYFQLHELLNLNIMKCLLITIQVARNFPRFRWVIRTTMLVQATTMAKGGMCPYKGYIGIHV